MLRALARATRALWVLRTENKKTAKAKAQLEVVEKAMGVLYKAFEGLNTFETPPSPPAAAEAGAPCLRSALMCSDLAQVIERSRSVLDEHPYPWLAASSLLMNAFDPEDEGGPLMDKFEYTYGLGGLFRPMPPPSSPFWDANLSRMLGFSRSSDFSSVMRYLAHLMGATTEQMKEVARSVRKDKDKGTREFLLELQRRFVDGSEGTGPKYCEDEDVVGTIRGFAQDLLSEYWPLFELLKEAEVEHKTFPEAVPKKKLRADIVEGLDRVRTDVEDILDTVMPVFTARRSVGTICLLACLTDDLGGMFPSAPSTGRKAQNLKSDPYNFALRTENPVLLYIMYLLGAPLQPTRAPDETRPGRVGGYKPTKCDYLWQRYDDGEEETSPLFPCAPHPRMNTEPSKELMELIRLTPVLPPLAPFRRAFSLASLARELGVTPEDVERFSTKSKKTKGGKKRPRGEEREGEKDVKVPPKKKAKKVVVKKEGGTKKAT